MRRLTALALLLTIVNAGFLRSGFACAYARVRLSSDVSTGLRAAGHGHRGDRTAPHNHQAPHSDLPADGSSCVLMTLCASAAVISARQVGVQTAPRRESSLALVARAPSTGARTPEPPPPRV